MIGWRWEYILSLPPSIPTISKGRILRNAGERFVLFDGFRPGLTRPRGGKGEKRSNIPRKPERENATTPSGGWTVALVRRPCLRKTSL